MHSRNVVHQATLRARQAVLIAFFGSTLLLSALLFKQNFFRYLSDVSLKDIVAAHKASEVINLYQERLSNAALRAAETGDEVWIDRYLSLLPRIDRAFREAAELSDGGVSLKLSARARASEQVRSALEAKALDHVREGDLAGARALLAGSEYLYHKRVVAEGTEDFVKGVIAFAENERKHYEQSERLAIVIVLPIAVIAAMALWRHLNVSLQRSESVHLAAEDSIKRLALNDALTGLSNRTSIRERLKGAILRAEANGPKVALLMIDLDRFKPVNDRHGHLVGDFVLKEVSRRLTETFDETVSLGRFGGDEFVAIVQYDGDDEIPRGVGQKIVEAISKPIALEDLTVEIGASVGLAVFPTDASDYDDLVGKAYLALYAAKLNGRGGIRWFDASMNIDLKKRAEISAELGPAIRNGEIVPYYQPIVDLGERRISGFEVLARWQHPTKGLIPPSDFIAVAEKNGLIDDLLISVLERACLEMNSLPPDLTIAINMAPCQIQSDRLAHRVLAVLSKTGFAPRRLEVELTETALVSDIEAAKSVIEALKNLGIRVALDDFGTGYSSLSYLSDLTFDKIKIDRSFIKSLHERQESDKIVGAIIGLGKILGALVVAEGIECERDEQVLRGMDCAYAQGYLYSKPVPSAELPQLIERFSGTRDLFSNIADGEAVA